MNFSAMQFLVWAHRAQLRTGEARVRFLQGVAFPVIAAAESESLRSALLAELTEILNALR